jgi:hypothetical protein
MEQNNLTTVKKWTYGTGVIHSLFFILGSMVFNLVTAFVVRLIPTTGNGYSAIGITIAVASFPTLVLIGYLIYSLAKRRSKYALGLMTIPGSFLLFYALILFLFFLSK